MMKFKQQIKLKMSRFFFKVKAKSLQVGSTLIELLIATMVVGLIVTAVANVITHSIKNTGEARYKQVATSLGQEVIEFVRSEKNRKGILNLKNTLVSGSYCFSKLPIDLELANIPTAGACNFSVEGDVVAMAGTNFTRDMIVSVSQAGASGPYSMNIKVTVSWIDGEATKTVELIQKFEETN